MTKSGRRYDDKDFDLSNSDEKNGADWITQSSCNEEEMNMLFRLCRDMMLTCFGEDSDGDTVDAFTNATANANNDQRPNLANDLVTQICQPIHCHHRLHRMAGHIPRHIVHWNDQWEQHHSFALGIFGWIVVLGIGLFYGCAFLLGLSGDSHSGSHILPKHRRKKNKFS